MKITEARGSRRAFASMSPLRLSDSDLLRQINVLDGVEDFNAFVHRFLKGLAPADQAHAAGALVDHRRAYRLLQIVLARLAATVDQPGTAHIAVRHLIARQINRMI